MTRQDLERVQKALRDAHREFEALAEEEIYFPSGPVVEQLEEAITITEVTLDAEY